MDTRRVSLYIHIPFCVRKCVYCDFASYPGREDVWHRYYDEVIREAESWSDRLRDAIVPTIFLGGGTPSLPPADETVRLLSAICGSFRVEDDAEITMEANPGTLDAEKLRVLRDAGVNRISFGVQSFDDGLLKTLGRIHTAEQAKVAIRQAREAGFDNISLDLMYALPGQSLKQWEDTLDQAIALSTEHISAYSLIVEEGTPLAKCVEDGTISVPDDDEMPQYQRMAGRKLAEHGYGRYEISNYARPGFESRHNTVYWEGGEYLGMGCAAHSLVNGERFENPRELSEYLSGKRAMNRSRRTLSDEKEEMLMLSTRMCKGLDLEKYKRAFGEDLMDTRKREIGKLEKHGLIVIEDDRLKLTEKGLELQDAVVLELMDI